MKSELWHPENLTLARCSFTSKHYIKVYLSNKWIPAETGSSDTFTTMRWLLCLSTSKWSLLTASLASSKTYRYQLLDHKKHEFWHPLLSEESVSMWMTVSRSLPLKLGCYQTNTHHVVVTLSELSALLYHHLRCKGPPEQQDGAKMEYQRQAHSQLQPAASVQNPATLM